MKRHLFLAVAMTFGLRSNMASGQTCLGIECPDDPFYDQGFPTSENGLFSWEDYGTWRGLSAGLHMPPAYTVQQCLSHCFEHARHAQQSCLQNGGRLANATRLSSQH